MTEPSCRLCGFANQRRVLHLVGMPRWNHRLLRPAEVATDRGVELSAYRCLSCGFVSVPMQLADDYYDDYVNVPSLSPQAQRFQLDQAGQFVERFRLRGRRVLEVGCGDGFFLQALQQAGAQAFGIEPSAAQARLAASRGLNVAPGVLSADQPLPDAPFDAFATRQVFEHVEDMRGFLLAIRAQLTPGAVGLVEVPNLDRLLEQDRFFDFIPEHINYFSPDTLTLALALAGFEVLETAVVQDGEALRALVRLRAERRCDGLAERAASLRRDVDGFVAACHARGQKVALWGAGGKGLSMLAVADLSKIDLLVDGDPHKHGLVTPVSHLVVAAPTEIARLGIGAVIVVAPAYEREIAGQLRSALAFSGPIMLAGGSFRSFD